MRVLVVEDSYSALRLLRRKLERAMRGDSASLTIVEASTMKEARKYLRGCYNLILVDGSFPSDEGHPESENGASFVTERRGAEGEFPAVIIGISGSPLYNENMLAAGADEAMFKEDAAKWIITWVGERRKA